MPFTSKELGCNKNDLNVLRKESDLGNPDSESFDFRQWLTQFEFSVEAKELYKSALRNCIKAVDKKYIPVKDINEKIS